MPLPEPVEDLIEVGARAVAAWKGRPDYANNINNADRAQTRVVLEAVVGHPDWSIVRRQEIDDAFERGHEMHHPLIAQLTEEVEALRNLISALDHRSAVIVGRDTRAWNEAHRAVTIARARVAALEVAPENEGADTDG